LLHVKIGKRRPRTLPIPSGLLDVLAVLIDTDKRPKFEGEGDGLFPGADDWLRAARVRALGREAQGTEVASAHDAPHVRIGAGATRCQCVDDRGPYGAPAIEWGRQRHHPPVIQVHGPELRAAMELLWE